MQLYLVRHGQSAWNVEGRVLGQAMDVPLTEVGRRQAQAAADELAATPLAAVWTSDQARARQTAEPIAAAHGLVPRTTPLLREQSLGVLEGRPSSELAAEPTPDGVDISEVAWGGGESVQQVYARALRLIDELRASFPDDAHVTLVSHGDFLRILMAALDGRGHRAVEWAPLEHATPLVRTLSGVQE